MEADSLSSFLISTSGWSLPAGFDTLKLANSSIQSKSYRPILGATYGAGMTIKAYRTVSAEIVGAVDIYSWKTIPNKFYYAYYSFLPGISSYSENVNKDIWTYAMSQQARYLRFSGGLRWELLNWYHPVRPYVEGGVSVQKLLSVSRNMQKFTYSSGVFQVADGADPVKGETIVTSPVGAFESTLAGWYGGIGLSLGRKDFSCAVGLRAGGMVGNIVDPLHRYEDQAALFEYFHVEDDLSLTWLSFQTTVAYTLRYAVKKRHNFASITKE